MKEIISEIFNCDCNDYMKSLPDKLFDLAVVDPPYGININMNAGRKKNTKTEKRSEKKWDNNSPNKSYFDELFRISKNQIIWGGNYFNLPITMGWIFWDKHVPTGVSFSDGELAWTSYNQALIKIDIPYCGFGGMEKDRFHPTQKPIDLYKWILKKYAKPGDIIFDSHMGSQSSRIAAYELSFDYYGCELDEDYFKAGCKRFETYKKKKEEIVSLGYAKTELEKINPILF